MAAVPDMHSPGPAVSLPESRPGAAPARIVAVAEDLTELRRPESDLARILAAVGISDLLVACDDRPNSTIASYLDYPDYDDEQADAAAADPAVVTPIDGAQFEVWTPPDGQPAVAAESEPEVGGMRVHRLGLTGPLGPPAEADLVAALSELVGFDPEPGVYCLAPTPAPADPARGVVVSAAQRIAQVYGLPLLRYRCLELSVVTGSG